MSGRMEVDVNLEEHKFFSVDEIAAILRCDSLMLYNEIHRGKLKAYRVGRIFRVLDSDLHEYLDARILQASVDIAAEKKHRAKK
jgi:excisionase family DNA binding protein